MSNHRTLRLLLAMLAALALVAAACGDDDDAESGDADTSEMVDTADTADGEDTSAMAETEGEDTGEAMVLIEGDLAGVLGIEMGACDDAGMPAGSYFRMVQAGGTAADGPFMDNADSTCSDLTYTPLTAGTDGGLVSGDYQPAPDPAFDEAGAALAAAIIEPVAFFGQPFGAATNPVDPQTNEEVPAPIVTATGGVLSGEVSAMSAYWAGEAFNQGAPKPGGTEDGPAGTIDPESGEYVLEWSSQIVGGAFNDFIGVWHLEGTFAAA